jgi:hypothetical protein
MTFVFDRLIRATLSLPDLTALAKFSTHGIARLDIPRRFHSSPQPHFVDKHALNVSS